MISCPFCGSNCNPGALICPFCKVELPPQELISTYRIILERDRSFLEASNRKKLDALAKKEFDVRQAAILAAKQEFAAERARLAEEKRVETEKRIREVELKAKEFNDKVAKNIKRFGVPVAALAVFVLIATTVVFPYIQERRLESKYKASTVSACNYAREVNVSMSAYFDRLETHLKSGKKFGPYWKKETDRITTTHIDAIRSNFVNPSSDIQIVSEEVNNFENPIAYDISRLRTVFSIYWDSQNLSYYSKDRILASNNQFIAWCDDNNA
jgi:thiamine kinase-like enzyme